MTSTGSGRYTTIEGLVQNIRDQLRDANPFVTGDSANPEARGKLEALLNRLENLMGLTIILDDPSGNSYVENPDEVTRYDRTFEQNDDLGLNDMKTENYQTQDADS